MALTASPRNFSSERCFSCNHESFPPRMFCCIWYTNGPYISWQISSSLIFVIWYHLIITSFLHTWKCMVPRHEFAWTMFPHSLEFTCLVSATHVACIDFLRNLHSRIQMCIMALLFS